MKRATIRTTHDDPDAVARALRPDNTDEMETTVAEDGQRVVTRIERSTTGGLHATVDDYVVNLEVATTVADAARSGDEQPARPADTGTVSDDEPEHDNE
ncbi:KEOPS complex subunit Pcc1 [Halopiger goleimassiliensis]|uniref:KEOPS complex subunit Pcc1 n=1 Tax=Halopiger goleimassiliensis TaxID=1293048 RepID=UPI00067760BE|nr:KEOPS complex subunit Pcc1 [Halopiger goleimassiliensis]